MKKDYLNDLRKILNTFEMSKSERDDIINDYAAMYDDGLEKGMEEQAIIEMLGTPEKAAKALSDEYRHIQKRHIGGRLIALMPFLSLITFFILGFYFDKWHPGWLVFLSIPMTAIIVEAFNKPSKQFLTALSPFVATVVYLGIGFGFRIWHPTWLIFLIIPILGIVNSYRSYDEIDDHKDILSQLTALSVFVAIVVYVLLGTYAELWNPGWLIFLIIPILGILSEKNKMKKILFISSILIAVAFYLFVGYRFGNWWYGALGFLLPIGLGILTNDIKFSFGKGSIWVKLTVILAVTLYFSTGILWNTWGFMWMIFLLIPMIAILSHGPKKHYLVALSPFIATIIFFSLGYFFGLWEISWMAFLMIPIFGILTKN